MLLLHSADEEQGADMTVVPSNLSSDSHPECHNEHWPATPVPQHALAAVIPSGADIIVPCTSADDSSPLQHAQPRQQ